MLFTSESVSPGHPDKIADQISDAVLDQALTVDQDARVAVECLVKEGLVVLAGEMTTSGWVDAQQIARDVIKSIGYNHPDMGFDYRSCGVLSVISQQSSDIANGISYQDNYGSIGAGDQGLMFGFACNETPNLMPAPIMYAHQLMRAYVALRIEHETLWPDAKCQVTCEYENGRVIAITDVVFSAQHAPVLALDELRDKLQRLIRDVLPHDLLDNVRLLINPAGLFIQGGPMADCGLTGRKIIVDTYGGYARHGGGAFSGKDPSKVDRSAAYMARYIAKNIVASEYAQKCEVQIAYAIGYPEPVSLYVNTGTGDERLEKKLEQMIRQSIDLTPSGIIRRFDMLKPIYRETANFGHFGNETFPWEKVEENLLK